jgi:membrane fusion protein (multidrug efflux system)
MNGNIKRETPERSAIGSVIATVVLGAVCVTGGWVACNLFSSTGPKGPPQMPAADVSVAVRKVERRVYNLPERFVAHAEAIQEVDLLPQVDGYISEIAFKEGDTVEKGQLLYVLDAERYQAVVNQRQADLAAAEAEERRARRYYERMMAADERGITQLERDNAEAAAEKAKAAVLQEKANLIVAEYDLKKTRVYAPIAGQIGKTTVHVGDYVAPSKGALAHIMQIDPIRVSFPLTDRAYVAWRDITRKTGRIDTYRTRLILPDGSEYDKEGAWDFDDNQMSRETATIIMRLSFPNPDRLLIPNSYLTLLADRRDPEPVVCVPQQAIFDMPGGNVGVYVLKADQTVEQRVVTVKEAFEGWSPVLTGLADGETVVISGLSKLHQGAKVKVVEATPNDDLDPNYRPPVKD